MIASGAPSFLIHQSRSPGRSFSATGRLRPAAWFAAAFFAPGDPAGPEQAAAAAGTAAAAAALPMKVRRD